MPSSATPTPLSPLAGIEQMLDAYRDAVWHNGKVGGLDSASLYHEEEVVDEDAPRQAILDYLAGLGKVLEALPPALTTDGLTAWQDYLDDCAEAVAKIRTYLSTPTSPRETVGKEKE